MEEKFIVYCKEYFVKYKVLSEIEFLKEFFKNIMGKILCCVLK